MDKDLIEKGVCLILDGLMDKESWIANPNFVETPERITKAYMELLSGIENTTEQVDKALAKTFPCTYSSMIFSPGIETVSMCPHHLLIVKYNITVAYIPPDFGTVIGASKLARVANILSARPVLQEQLTEDLCSTLTDRINPLGVAVVVSGQHQCMQIRGVKQSRATFETSLMTGNFRTQPETRAEFFSLLANSKR